MNFYTCKHSSRFRIETCIEMINAQLRDLALTGVQAVGEHIAGGQARFTEGIIMHLANHVAADTDCQGKCAPNARLKGGGKCHEDFEPKLAQVRRLCASEGSFQNLWIRQRCPTQNF